MKNGVMRTQLRIKNLLYDIFTNEGQHMPLSCPNVSVTDIQSGVPFSFATPVLIYSPAVTLLFGLALVDKNNNIKEIISETKSSGISSETILNVNLSNSYFDCVVKSEISDSDNLRMITKESGTDKWKLVNDNWDIKAGIGVTDNIPQFVNAIWEIEPDHKIRITNNSTLDSIVGQEELETNFSKLLKGARYIVHSNSSIHMSNTSAVILVNDKVKSFCSLNNAAFRYDAFYDFFPDEEDLSIKVLTLVNGEGESRDIRKNNKGDLKEYFAKDNCNHVVDLTLSGIGADLDYDELRKNVPFLSSLNISSYLPENNKIIANALSDLPDLSNVVLPENVETIGAKAFMNNFLRTITIPSSVKNIEDYAFNQSGNCLEAVFSKAMTPPDLGLYVFGDDLSNKILYVLPGTIEDYRQQPGWSGFGTILESENPVMETYTVTIQGITYKLYPTYAAVLGYNEVECPEEVEFESHISYGNNNYTVTTIEPDAFIYNKKIKKLIIPETVEELGYNCFNGCHNLEEVTIKGPVKVLPISSFENCFELHSINFPPTLEIIDQYAMYGLASLRELRLPSSIKMINWNGLTNMKSLERIIFEGENDNFNLVDGTLYSKDWYYIICHTNGNKDNTDIKVHDEVVSAYWFPFSSKYIKTITLPETTLRELPIWFFEPDDLNYAFERMIIPDYLNIIPESSFYLPKHLTLGKGVDNIGQQQIGFGDYHIYCKNNVTFNAEDLCIPDVDSGREDYQGPISNFYFYTSLLKPNVNLDYEKYSNEQFYYEKNIDFYHLRVPGAVSGISNGWKESQTEEMWKYNLDKDNGILYLGQTLSGIEIIDLRINGVSQAPVTHNNFKVTFSNPEELNTIEVEVDFMVNNMESFTTIYDADFNSHLPSSEPVLVDSSVEWIQSSEESAIVVYNISGQILFSGEKGLMPKLPAGIYIIQSANKTRKVIIK